MAWNELHVHRWLAERPAPRQLTGSAQHDAAVLGALGERAVVCCDQAIVGVHVDADTSGADFGAKACLRTLSDLAAAAAEPVAVTLAGRFPDSAEEAFVRATIEGAAEAAEAHGAELVAGDLAAGPGPAGLAVSALGRLPLEPAAPGRDRARPGQVWLTTGPFGGSRLGRHLRPVPRLAAGRALWELGATALIDVSDGFALDAERLGQASGVRLTAERLPLHADAERGAADSGRSPREHALGDGEDHELLATLERAAAERFLERAAGVGCPDAALLGQVSEAAAPGEAGLWLALDPGEPPRRLAGPAGYVHGAPAAEREPRRRTGPRQSEDPCP